MWERHLATSRIDWTCDTESRCMDPSRAISRFAQVSRTWSDAAFGAEAWRLRLTRAVNASQGRVHSFPVVERRQVRPVLRFGDTSMAANPLFWFCIGRRTFDKGCASGLPRSERQWSRLRTPRCHGLRTPKCLATRCVNNEERAVLLAGYPTD